MADQPKDPEVGYCKPPKATQFTKGVSGNPKGRPKGAKNFKTDLAEELAEKIVLKEGGKQKKVSKQRALLKAAFSKALNGDQKACATVLSTILKVLPTDEQPGSSRQISEQDATILADYETWVLLKGPNHGAAP